MIISNTQDLESTPLSICWCGPTADGVTNRDSIERPSVKIVCKRNTAALFTVTKDITCADCDQHDFHQLQEMIRTAHGSSLWRS